MKNPLPINASSMESHLQHWQPMTVRPIPILFLSALTLAAQTIGVIRPRPLLSPQEAANLESRVLQNPEDINARIELLQFYLHSNSPNADPGRASVRLQHILYLVEHHPELAASASPAAYVYRANGPSASPVDHDAVRGEWLAAVEAHPKNGAVALNAMKFLEVEDPSHAEQVLRHAVDNDLENRELAANLGFLYARELLRSDLADHANTALEQTSNAIILAAAGTALPNLAKSRIGLYPDTQKLFDLASQLSARARQLAPDDPDIQGPMPLIKYFVYFLQAGPGIPALAASSPARIRVSGDVQMANLIRSLPPEYPELARAAGVTGDVRFRAFIARDGTVQNLKLISGHPLLVDAAMRAAQTWRFKPTLLNGAPVEVVTTITIHFPPN